MMNPRDKETAPANQAKNTAPEKADPARVKEIGGSGKAEPTRYGDWEVGGRCTDF